MKNFHKFQLRNSQLKTVVAGNENNTQDVMISPLSIQANSKWNTTRSNRERSM